MFIDAAEIPRAWNYYRLIGEPGPIHDAIENVVLREEDEFYPLVEIALHQGIHPRKGFDLILDRQGICNAITVFGGFEAALAPRIAPIAAVAWSRLCTISFVNACGPRFSSTTESSFRPGPRCRK